ncbi:MAG: AAA family ATPase [Proteobacteria bacterium]|nr:AAA family ATPase [Pseudomonadota bacterium]
MQDLNIQPLVSAYHRKLSDVSLTFKRYLYHQINWDVRMIGIKGERGVGKTTLVLQHIRETFHHPDDALYVSLDNLWFSNHSPVELADYLYAHGIMYLFLDEVHRYPGWSLLLKNLYDNYPKLNIVYTGSSILEIDNSRVDLSRRQTLYTLNGLSFREYLEFENLFTTESFNLNELLENHIRLAMDITAKVKVLKYFGDYLKFGFYPFYKEVGPDYAIRLQEIQKQIIECDLPASEKVTFETMQKMKKLMMIIAESLPFVPNVSHLCQSLTCTRDSCLKMLYTLDRSRSLHLLTSELKNYKKLASPDKVFLGNTNIMYALSCNNALGTIRETFFANQVGAIYPLQCPKVGDFLVDGQYLFEVGGANKSFNQIKDTRNSFLAVDENEIGYGARIPLWMFGFLY